MGSTLQYVPAMDLVANLFATRSFRCDMTMFRDLMLMLPSLCGMTQA